MGFPVSALVTVPVTVTISCAYSTGIAIQLPKKAINNCFMIKIKLRLIIELKKYFLTGHTYPIGLQVPCVAGHFINTCH
jgi:hypothetical protein